MPKDTGRLVAAESPAVIKRLERIARDHGMSVAAMVRLAIRREILDD
jgi:hypothetical protein